MAGVTGMAYSLSHGVRQERAPILMPLVFSLRDSLFLWRERGWIMRRLRIINLRWTWGTSQDREGMAILPRQAVWPGAPQ